MEEKVSSAPPKIERPFGVWVIVAGFLWTGLALMIYTASLMGGAGASDPTLLAGPVIGGILFLAAFVAWRARKSSFIASTVIAIVFLLLLVAPLAGTLANPADSSFWLVSSVLGALVLSIVFSILCLRALPSGLSTSRFLGSVRSPGGLLAGSVTGLVLAAILVSSVIATNVQSGLNGQGADADVRIVAGAQAAKTPFTPAFLNVTAGQTVVFFNGDTTEHSVTGENATFGSSPLLRAGAEWQVNLTTPGEYKYFCGPHPWMKGTINVTP